MNDIPETTKRSVPSFSELANSAMDLCQCKHNSTYCQGVAYQPPWIVSEVDLVFARDVHCRVHIERAIMAGKKDAKPFLRVEYPEYPNPTAGMIGIAKQRQVTTKSTSVRLDCAKSSAWVSGVESDILR